MVDFHKNINRHGEGPNGAIPPQPLWLGIIRAVQAVFNILVLSLAANAASYIYRDGFGMAFFTFCWTVIFLLYIWLTPQLAPQFYFFWGHIAFEATVWLFWLVTFALLADYVRAWDSLENAFGRGWRSYGGDGAGFVDSTRAALAFAILNWFLFSATLGITFWLSSRSSPTVVDGAPTHAPASGGGFKFGNLGARFSRKKATTDTEKGVQDGTGQYELNNQPEVHAPNQPAQTYQQPGQYQ